MKQTLFIFWSLFVSSIALGANCHPYIHQLASGNVRYSVTLPGTQAYVEVFVRQNGIQNIAKSIVNNKINNGDGTYTYQYTAPATQYVTGDVIVARFYSYQAGQPGVFTPGPAEHVWCDTFYYNQTCKSVYVSTNGSDQNPGTVDLPVRTISYGYALAKKVHTLDVKVAAGTYNEGSTSVSQYGTSLIILESGISLLGGYASDFQSRNYTTNITKLVAPNGGTQIGGPRIILAKNITEPTLIEGFEFVGGVSQQYGGGIAIINSTVALNIRYNKITNNFASYQAKGGNVYMENSSSKVHDNVLTNGFAGLSSNGSDMYITGNYNGIIPKVYSNLFTRPSSVVGAANASFYSNKYLFAIRSSDEELNGDVVNASVYPNPMGESNLLFFPETGKNISAKIVNAAGTVVFESQNWDTSSPLDLQGLESGIYQLVVEENGEISLHRIVR